MSYDASSIEVLKGLDPVRKRPGMYTETNRPNHLAQEVIDNAIDEALGGYASHVSVVIHQDQSMSVTDNGRGMPIEMHPKEKKPTYEVILGTLHSGGKFSGENYNFSGGLHGVGVSVVNGLSKRLELEVWKDGTYLFAPFKAGKPQKKEVIEQRIESQSSEQANGTRIRFHPDESFFDTARFQRSSLKQNLRSKAILCPGVTISFWDEENDDHERWYYENGLPEYFAERQEDAEDPVPESGWEVSAQWQGGECDLVFSFSSDGHSMLADSFANLIPTPQGGTHVKAVRNGVAQAVRDVGETLSLTPKKTTLTVDDVSGAMNLLVSIKLKEPQFSGQTKERLSNSDFVNELTSQVKDRVEQLLHNNPQQAQQIIQIAVERANTRTKAKKQVKRKKATSGLSMPEKLADCTGNNFDDAELYLVEGDSAGGSAKQARDRTYQAIMPLRGKILNSWEVEPEDIFSSKEVADITTVLGVDPRSDDLTGLRYNKICVLADADSDGLHIATLLCALFFKHFPDLVEKGHIHIALPPLYRIDQGKDVYYAHSDDEKDQITEKLVKKKGAVNVQRFKGLGEMNPEQLRETVMNPESRNLIQLISDDPVTTTVHMDMLLSKKKAGNRRKWLEENGGHVAHEDIL